jgi:predicted enzyme related to lactoylglutathione lyase
VAFVATTDLARARTFYEEVVGLTLVEANPYAAVFESGATTLRVTLVERASIAPYTVLGWVVDDIASAATELRLRGATFERFDGMEQDDGDAWTAPGGAKVAWFKDPEGNTLSLAQL